MNLVKAILTLTAFFVALMGCAGLNETISKDDSNSDEADIQYGRKLILIMGCNDCHTTSQIGSDYGPEDEWLLGNDMGFNGPYGTLYPTNLRLLINEISEDEWIRIAQKMRRDSPMAWSQLPQLDKEDLLAIYRFVKYLGPKGVPAPKGLPPGVVPETEHFFFPLPH